MEGHGRKPIPSDWLKFTARTSLQSTKPQNRNASHPVNAMLNYAYAVLESRVRLEIVAHGYDPMIGYLHSYDKDRAALVFDLMEPLRPVVDHNHLGFYSQRAIQYGRFHNTPRRCLSTNPELAKTLVGLLESQALGISLLVQRSLCPPASPRAAPSRNITDASCRKTNPPLLKIGCGLAELLLCCGRPGWMPIK